MAIFALINSDMMRTKLTFTYFLTSLALAAAPVAELPDSSLALREVSVTAIKQSASLERLPVASTLVSAGDVGRFNIVTMKQVSEISPNLYIPDYGSRMTSSIYMRGIGARIDQPAVGLNVDNVPFLNKDNYDFDLVDIDRIEVSRGPQSVMYGRNTMAGLINIYTLSPLKWQGLRVTAEWASARSSKLSAGVYRMLSADLGMSLSAYYTHTDGFYRNLYNGSTTGRENQASLRWKTSWRPSAALSVDNTASLTVSRQSGYPYESAATGVLSYNDTCFYRRTGIADGLTVNWRAGSVDLASISSFQYINDNMTLDQDFLPLEYFTLSQIRHEWAFTQDFVASGRAGSRYGWKAGAFGFYRRSSMSAPVNFGPDGIAGLITGNYNHYNPSYPIVWDDDHLPLNSDFTSPTSGLALYHESTLTLGRLTLTAGLRLAMERASLSYRSHTSTGYSIIDATVASSPQLFAHVPLSIDENGHLSLHNTVMLPKLAVAYSLDADGRRNVYFSVAKGYKAGGYNTQMFSDVLQQRLMYQLGMAMNYDVDDIVSYRPEKSWNWEIGAHFSALDRRLTGQLAAFYISCRDQQLTMFPEGTTTGRIMANAGKSRSYGVELSARFTPAPRWAINAAYGWTDATFREFNNGRADYSGRRVPYAPAHTLFGGVTYTHPLGLSWLSTVAATCSARAVGDIYWDEANTARQPFYGLLNASVTLGWRDCSLDIWGYNLTGTRYATFYFVSMGNSFLQRGNPRRWGATLRLNFASR